MSFKKFGTGEVTETEGALSKTATSDEWTPTDEQALRSENAQADTETTSED